MSTPYNPKNSGSSIITPGNTAQGSIIQSDISRTLPRQISTGSLRGTQTVGYGSVKIDGSNNRIVIGDTNGDSLSIGSIQANLGNSNNIAGFGLSVIDNNNSFITLGLDANNESQLVYNDAITNRMFIGNQKTFGEGVYVSRSGINALTNTNPNGWIFNSNQNIFKIVATFPVSVASITVASGGSNSTSGTIDLSSYPANAIILPIARISGQPSFIWQGEQGLLGPGTSGGIVGWSVLADYSTSFTFGGTMQLSRTLINASGSPYTDTSYNITVYVLQETAA